MGDSVMKSSSILLTFLCTLSSVILTAEDEDRQFDLSTLLGLGAVGLTGVGLAGLAGTGISATSSLLGGGKGGKGKGLFGGKGGKGLFGGKGGKGKGGKGLLSGLFGGKGGKGKGRSLVETEEDRQNLGALLGLAGPGGLSSLGGLSGLLGNAGALSALAGNSPGGISNLLGGAGGFPGSTAYSPTGLSGLSNIIGTGGAYGLTGPLSGIGKGGKFGKGGKGFSSSLIGNSGLFGGKGGKGALTLFGGRSLSTSQLDRHGKGKDGKGKGKDGKGGKKGKSASESSLLDLFSNNLLGQILQSVLNLLTGAVSSIIPLRTTLEPKTDVTHIPNPLSDPLGFIQHPLISAIVQALVSGDINAVLQAQGDLAGTLITQFISNAIAGVASG